MKVYGPYRGKDGRSRVVIINDYGVQYTQSYPRYLMEQHLGRKLEDWEQVDHINEDHTDDRIENFQLLTKTENNKKSAIPAEMGTYICPECEIVFTKSAATVRHNQGTYGRPGPFCGKSCAGKHNARMV